MEKLKSVLKNPRLALLLKSFIFAVLVNWFLMKGGGFAPSILLLGISAILYLKPIFNSQAFARSLGVLLAIIIFLPQMIVAAGALIGYDIIYGYRLPAVILFFILFWIILGLKELILIHRRWWHLIVSEILFYISAIFYFASPKSNGVVTETIFLATVAFLLFSELAEIHTKVPRRYATVGGLVFALIASEGAWAASLLPIGFLSSANLIAIGGFIFIESLILFYSRKLDIPTIINRFLILFLLAIMILVFSRWRL